MGLVRPGLPIIRWDFARWPPAALKRGVETSNHCQIGVREVRRRSYKGQEETRRGASTSIEKAETRARAIHGRLRDVESTDGVRLIDRG